MKCFFCVHHISAIKLKCVDNIPLSLYCLGAVRKAVACCVLMTLLAINCDLCFCSELPTHHYHLLSFLPSYES